MQLPRERGPISQHVIETLRREAGRGPSPPGRPRCCTTPDAQLALWILYELHYRGFEDVPDDREWDPGLLGLRASLEARFRAGAARAATRPLAGSLDDDGDFGDRLVALIDADDSPSLAAFLQRDASREQVLDFLRERSVQQLKESDPQSFVLPRLDGPAKVALAELQYDEYGGGRPERLHSTLYAQALRDSGLDHTYGAYIDEVSALSLAWPTSCPIRTPPPAAWGGHGSPGGVRGDQLGAVAQDRRRDRAGRPARRRRCLLPRARRGRRGPRARRDQRHLRRPGRRRPVPARRRPVRGGRCLHLAALSGAELLARWTPEMEAAS